MEQYIPKSALVAEIESKIKKYTKRGEESDAKCDGYGMYWGGVLSCLNEIRTLCDTLEVKEAEEPVSIWHDSNEEQPNFASTVATWSPKYKNGEIISRCTEVYSDRIWAYIDDLLKM